MFQKNIIGMFLLCLCMLTSMLGTTTATQETNYVISATQETNILPALTFKYDPTTGDNGIKDITESKIFQDYLKQNSIDTTDYRMEVVSPESSESNLIMLTDGINKWYYKISNDNSSQMNNQQIIVGISQAISQYTIVVDE